MSFKTIDVSTWQGSIDWERVKKSGMTAAMIRVGGRYGVSGKIYTDKMGQTNLTNAIKAGVKVGVYFFTQAVNEREAVEEAQFCINAVKNHKITLPIAIDSEHLDSGRHNKITRSQRTAVCKAFCATVKKAGYVPMIYASTSWFNGYLDMTKLPYDVWCAQWAKSCTYKGEVAIWQYSDNGTVPGVSGRVDMNICYKDYDGASDNSGSDESGTSGKKLTLTGKVDKATVLALQKWMNTTEDGVISGQNKITKKYIPNVTAVTWENTGSMVIRALQRYLNGKGFEVGAVDGLIGQKTVKGIQKFLNKNGAKLTVDGYLGPLTAKAFQKYLNKVLYS